MNLLAKKLWEELLDDEQPDITIMDWCALPSLTTCSCHPRLPRAQTSLLPRARAPPSPIPLDSVVSPNPALFRPQPLLSLRRQLGGFPLGQAVPLSPQAQAPDF